MQTESEFVFGGPAIAAVVDMGLSATFKSLNRASLPAKKVRGVWVARRSALVAWKAEREAEREARRQARNRKPTLAGLVRSGHPDLIAEAEAMLAELGVDL